MDPRRRTSQSSLTQESDSVEETDGDEIIPHRKSRVIVLSDPKDEFQPSSSIKQNKIFQLPRTFQTTTTPPRPSSGFVPKLNSVMGISYMSSQSFRQPNSKPHQNAAHIPTEKPHLLSLKGGGSYSYQTTFDTFVPKLNDVMNLSYMDSKTFRNPDYIQTFGDDFKKVTPKTRTRKVVKRKRKGLSQNFKELDRRQNSVRGIQTESLSQWKWPTTMDFNNFNFNSFDAQFTNQKQETHPSIVLPGVYSLNKDESGNSYSLTILL